MDRALKFVLVAIAYIVVWYILIYSVMVLWAGWPWGFSIVAILGSMCVWPLSLLFWTPLALIEIVLWVLGKQQKT